MSILGARVRDPDRDCDCDRDRDRDLDPDRDRDRDRDLDPDLETPTPTPTPTDNAAGPTAAANWRSATMIIMRVGGGVGLLFVLVACNEPPSQTVPGADGSSRGDDTSTASNPGSDQPEAGLAIGDVWSPPVPADAGSPTVPRNPYLPYYPARDAAGWVTLDATTLDAAGPSPPPRACNADAGDDGGLCPLPLSRCADAKWLVYYDNGQCVLGQCTWDKKYFDCGNIGCFGYACQSAPTLAALP